MRAQRLFLIGAGKIHREVLRRWTGRKGLEQVEMVVVDPAGAAADGGITVYRETCTGFDPVAQKVFLSGSGPQHYDYISFNIGSQNRNALFKEADLESKEGKLEVTAAMNTPIFS